MGDGIWCSEVSLSIDELPEALRCTTSLSRRLGHSIQIRVDPIELENSSNLTVFERLYFIVSNIGFVILCDVGENTVTPHNVATVLIRDVGTRFIERPILIYPTKAEGLFRVDFFPEPIWMPLDSLVEHDEFERIVFRLQESENVEAFLEACTLLPILDADDVKLFDFPVTY